MGENIPVTRSSMPKYEEYVDEIKDLWNSHWLTNMGDKHNTLEEKLTQYLKVENLQLLTNGHMSLELGIQALNLTEGEVITTPFTFASTTHAIVRNGLTPVFCDINPNDYTIDVTKVEKLITKNTVAIVPVHVYGNICQVEALEKIAQTYDLKLIYDAAHAFGETYKGKGIGQFGDISCFSFHATKVFNTIEGGAVTYNDTDFGKRLYSIKNFGMVNPEKVEYIGANAKMNEFCAAMGLCNLKHIETEIEKRKLVDERYRMNLTGVAGIKLRPYQKEVKTNFAYFPIEIVPEVFGKNRDEIQKELAKQGIYARKYFYPLTSTFDCYHGKYDINKTPIAERVSKNILTLPIYADLELDDVDRICNIVL